MPVISSMKFVAAITLFSASIIAGCDIGPQTRLQPLHLPPPGFEADASIGKMLFATTCQSCHGYRAQGSEKGPPLVHELYAPDHHADLAFHWAARDGVKQHHWHFGDMPPVENITPESVGHIAAYVRDEQRRAGIR